MSRGFQITNNGFKPEDCSKICVFCTFWQNGTLYINRFTFRVIEL